jgi:serralysin
VISSAALGNVPTTRAVVATGDFNGDGMADILWRDNLGNTSMWFMNGTSIASTAGVGNIPTTWTESQRRRWPACLDMGVR